MWGNKDLDQVVAVRPDGKISFPLAGEVKAAGLTVPAAHRDSDGKALGLGQESERVRAGQGDQELPGLLWWGAWRSPACTPFRPGRPSCRRSRSPVEWRRAPTSRRPT